jgi:hypothetical protein
VRNGLLVAVCGGLRVVVRDGLLVVVWWRIGHRRFQLFFHEFSRAERTDWETGHEVQELVLTAGVHEKGGSRFSLTEVVTHLVILSSLTEESI